MRYKGQFPAKNEDGLVALLVVGIMIILLSLTTVAFTKLMGREAQQALDRALSTQAYYAAESGINDAQDYINTHPEALLTGSNCDVLAQKGYPPYLGPSTSVTSDVNKVTCVVADTSPEQLFFQIPAGESRIFEMSSASTFGGILFSWQNSNEGAYNQNNYKVAGSKFATAAAWNTGPATAPVLEVTYYALPDTSPDLSSQISAGRTIFLYPYRTAASRTASTYNNGQADGLIVAGPSCQNQPSLLAAVFSGATNVYYCNTVVTPAASKHIFVKVSSFYDTASLAVRAVDNTGSHNAISIQNAQAVLDSTGKGGPDVLKRLQTVMDYRANDLEPGDAIETVAGLCKRLEYNLTLDTPQVDDPAPDAATSPACAIN